MSDVDSELPFTVADAESLREVDGGEAEAPELSRTVCEPEDTLCASSAAVKWSMGETEHSPSKEDADDIEARCRDDEDAGEEDDAGDDAEVLVEPVPLSLGPPALPGGTSSPSFLPIASAFLACDFVFARLFWNQT